MAIPRHPSSRGRYLLAATYGLTSSLIAPTLHAAHCGESKGGDRAGLHGFQSALPSLDDRCEKIKTPKLQPASREQDIAAAATSSLYLTTLVVALERSGHSTALRQGGPFTLFAPTNQTFSDLDREQR